MASNFYKYFVFLLALFSFMGIDLLKCQEVKNDRINIIPTPFELIIQKGEYKITPSTFFNVTQEAFTAADYLREKINSAAGIKIKFKNDLTDNSIQFVKVSASVMPGKESYSLLIKKNGIKILANSGAGFFYAVQTILQLFPPEILHDNKSKPFLLKLPCVFIKDAPKYSWRSFMLDSGRQFQTTEFIKKYLDYLAMLKINVFHWHLTEGQGWRIEIKSYPKLTEIGSHVAGGEEQQGFYTQNDVKEIVEYAKSRFITVVPEIDVPGHSEAALIAYPEYSCFGKAPESVMEFSPNIFCAGNEKTYSFLYAVLDEVCGLFPGEYIHLGGDEAPKDNWDSCSQCRAAIRLNGLKNSHELQVYFASRLAEHVKQKGKKIILWGDILEQPLQKLPENVIIYWWNYRKKTDIAYRVALQNGCNVICGTNYYTYLNFPVTPWSKYKIDRTFDLRKSYEQNPSDISAPSSLVLGMGTCLWTDWNVKMDMIDKRVFPRIFALAEQMWNRKEKMPFDLFYEKVKSQYNRLKILGIDYGPAMENEITKDFHW
jgi:N-acetyl-beta-hexosaminidase